MVRFAPAAIRGDRRMLIEWDEQGNCVLDPTALGQRFSISPDELRRRMRLGLVTSRVEVGEGEHAGLRRLTVWCGAEVWRAVRRHTDLVSDWSSDGCSSDLRPRGPTHER